MVARAARCRYYTLRACRCLRYRQHAADATLLCDYCCRFRAMLLRYDAALGARALYDAELLHATLRGA